MQNIFLIILALIGFILAVYAFIVERKIKQDKSYIPICDINKNFSCSENFKSKYAHTFRIKNSAAGIFFYLLVVILALANQIQIIFYLSIPAILFTIYLAFTSFFIIKNFCPVCTLTYIVNFLIVTLSYK